MSETLGVVAFECNVAGEQWQQIINARTPGQAKVEYWRDVRDAWPDVPYTAIRCRKVGPAQTSEDFARVAQNRGLPQARCGMRVDAGGRLGTIVGHNSSANFDVLFDDAKYPLSVHPHGLRLLEAPHA